MKTIVGQQTLTWNEMARVFAETKSLIKTNWLYSSSDPNDLQPMMPNHFRLGRALIKVPQGPFKGDKELAQKV